MKKLVNFNVNHYVYVKLTQLGLDIMKKKHYELYKHSDLIIAWKPPVIDESGFTKFQMHELMYEFGDHMLASNKVPFETGFYFEIDENENN